MSFISDALVAAECSERLVCRVLIVALPDFVDALERQLHILDGEYKRHQLRYGRVELTHDKLHGEHRAEGHLPVDHGGCREYGYEHILYLVDEEAAGLLILLHFLIFELHVEEIGLHVLPLMAAACLAALQLYFLHGRDELQGLVLIAGMLLEETVIDSLAPRYEGGYPYTVGCAAEQEDQEYHIVVRQQHHTPY